MSDVVQNLAPGQHEGVGAWSKAVGQAFLQPYGLNADASTFTAAGTAAPVHQQALQRISPTAAQVYTYQPGSQGNVSEERCVWLRACSLQEWQSCVAAVVLSRKSVQKAHCLSVLH